MKETKKILERIFFFEESDMISNIFNDANLGNTVYEPGSHLTIIDATAI